MRSFLVQRRTVPIAFATTILALLQGCAVSERCHTNSPLHHGAQAPAHVDRGWNVPSVFAPISLGMQMEHVESRFGTLDRFLVMTSDSQFRDGAELRLANGVSIELGCGSDQRVRFIETSDERVRILGQYGMGTSWERMRRDFPDACLNGRRMTERYIVQVHGRAWLVYPMVACINPEARAIAIQLRDDSDTALSGNSDFVPLPRTDPTCTSQDTVSAE